MFSETWQPVLGWEELYEVSSHGRVRSFDRVVRCGYGKIRVMVGKLLKAWEHEGGYPTVELQDRSANRKRRIFAHRLTCEAFNGPAPSTEHEVAHGDGNPKNGHFSNLRWATHAENEADKVKHGTRLVGDRVPTAKLTNAQALEIRNSAERGCDLAARFGVCRAGITNIRNGKIWKYLEAT